ncbi:hypothetical protein [Pseudoalteromonas pernae]|uniref:hypothetical protein n=1 Tax=Pseudoalteromonas pernae TaxID=3118054 RepID=UPI003241ED62
MTLQGTLSAKHKVLKLVLAAVYIVLLGVALITQNTNLIALSSLLAVPLVLANLSAKQVSLGNPFEHLKVEQGVLSVQGTLVPINEIRKVVVDRVKDQGIFQLPYNSGGDISLVFDQEHVEELKEYLTRTIPGVEIVT